MDRHTITLVKRCKNNEKEAFNELFDLYEGYLYRICYNFTHSKDESLDLMQEVYLKVFNAFHGFDETRCLLPWLKRITINTIINYHKKRKILEVPLENGWEQTKKYCALEDCIASRDDTENAVLINDMRNVVDRLIAELPEQYRLALSLRYHEGMSYEEIASALAQPLGTIKNSVYRARNLLRKRMQSCGLLEV